MKYIAIILLFTSCVDLDFQVDPRLKPYFNQFVIDAKQRGVTIDRDNLIMKLKDLSSENAVGLYDPAVVQKYVFIDSATFFYRPYMVHQIVYHEMGHAFLNRNHCTGFSYMNERIKHRELSKVEIDSLNNELFR